MVNNPIALLSLVYNNKFTFTCLNTAEKQPYSYYIFWSTISKRDTNLFHVQILMYPVLWNDSFLLFLLTSPGDHRLRFYRYLRLFRQWQLLICIGNTCATAFKFRKLKHFATIFNSILVHFTWCNAWSSPKQKEWKIYGTVH